MPWRVAQSLLTLRDEVDQAWPDRDRRADGTIGDAAHRSRSSDHNPWVRDGAYGVVTAIDITDDQGIGQHLWEHFLETRDRRIKYVIWNRQIVSAVKAPWRPRPYSGSNPHTKHIHLSVHPRRTAYDDTSTWGLDDMSAAIEGIQRALAAAGFDPGPDDGVWGPMTEAAFRASLAQSAPAYVREEARKSIFEVRGGKRLLLTEDAWKRRGRPAATVLPADDPIWQLEKVEGR